MSSNTYLKNFQRLKSSVKTINPLTEEKLRKTKEEIIEEKIRKERKEGNKRREIEKKYEKYLENILFDSDDNSFEFKDIYIMFLEKELTRIGLRYPYYDIDRYLQRKEIQEYITELKIRIKLTKQERDKLDKTIGRKTIDSKSKSDIYKKVIKRFEKEESNLDKELKRTTGIIKDISGLTDEEFEAIIDTVLKATNERINNKKEYLQLTEKIIQFLNKSLSKSPLIIDLPLEEFKQKYI